MREPRRGTIPRPWRQEAYGSPLNDNQSLGPGTVPAASGAGTAPVQRWLDVKLLKGRTQDSRTRSLAQKANAYNSNRKSKSLKDRLNELHQLEVATYQWLDAEKSPDLESSETARWAKGLMNEVQREHQELVRTSIDNNHADPPVANFDQLNQKQQTKVRALWTNLVNQSGNVRITETEDYTDKTTRQKTSRQHQGFRYEVLAQFARLLETNTGRDLVGQIDQDTGGQRLVTIRPSHAHETATVPGSEFAAGPADSSGEDKLKEVDVSKMFHGQKDANRKREAYSRNNFVALNLNGGDPKRRAKAIYDARRYNPKMKGVRIGGKHYQFGQGTAVNVTMTRDIPDADTHHTSRMVDETGNELIFPNFITLGHELGHAIHMKSGVALGGVSNSLFPKVDPGAHAKGADWSDLEEHGTINTVENALRSEYGLSERYGHINQPVFQKELLEPVVTELYNLSDEQPRQHRRNVEGHLNPASTSLGQLKIDDARKSANNAVNALLGQVDTVFPQFTHQELVQVKTTLRQAQTHLASASPDKLQQAVQQVQQAVQHVKAAKQRVQQAQPQQQPQAQAPQQQGLGIFQSLRSWLPW